MGIKLRDLAGKSKEEGMQVESVNYVINQAKTLIPTGPVALIFAEDDVEIESTLRHHIGIGFKILILFHTTGFQMPEDIEDQVIQVPHRPGQDPQFNDIITRLAEQLPRVWFYYCFNAEYLFFPFSETRTVGEMLAFHTEERRWAMLAYVVDLYADNLGDHPNAVNVDEAFLDRSGYYALARKDPHNHNHPKERQLDFHGGLKWRYEEHVPPRQRKIDRIALFRGKEDQKLELYQNHTFNIEEYNTYACPWHNNLTAAIASFRTAKALKNNPGSTFDVPTFKWHNSIQFEWHSRQLLDLGLMEPGQWF